jgi:hypothetical protein
MKIIEEKAKTGIAKEHHAKVGGTVAHDVVDLLDLLKKSIAKSGRAANDQRPGLKKARPAHADASETGTSRTTSSGSKDERAPRQGRARRKTKRGRAA